ncbi:MAG: VWA domain-containing protein [Bacteroidaceae bacterium]|nr:VWA domain-containing protein [Bacteroidaceae bacterium]
MFKFANPEYLYLLAVLPLLVILHIFTNIIRRRRLETYGDPSLLRQLMPEASTGRPKLKFWLLTAAFGIGCLLLARPQFGSKQETVTRKGIETVIALDVSNSMLADDVTPNRLEKSKRIISNLVEQFKDDKTGLIVFAGDAFVQLPITSDYISAKVFLGSISPGIVARQGTDIKAAIDLATKSFTPNEGVGKAIIVITDGENHEGGAVEAAQAAAEKGYLVYVLGVGLPSGTPIPGERSGEFRKDKDGNVVVTRLNENMCREIASAGGGAYFYVDNSNSAEKALQKELDKLAKADIETTVYTEYDEQFRIFAWIILALLLIEMFIGESRNPGLERLRLFKAMLPVILFIPAQSVSAQRSDRSYVRKGNKMFADSLFIKAEENYLKAIDANPELYQGFYDLGNSYTAQQKPNEAVEQYGRAANRLEEKKKSLLEQKMTDSKDYAKVKEELAKVYHNKGVVYHACEQYDKAVEAYKDALRNNPLDDETRYNMILAQKMLQQQRQQQQQQQQDQNQDQQQQQEQNQQQQEQQDQNQDQNQEQQQQQQPEEMSQENAEQLLDAAMQDEKEVQERVQQQLIKVQPKQQLEKDW